MSLPKTVRYDLLRHSSLDRDVASAMRIARLRMPPMQRFAHELGARLGRSPFSRQTIYSWESGESRVPGAVLLAAAELLGVRIDELLAHARGDFVLPRD